MRMIMNILGAVENGLLCVLLLMMMLLAGLQIVLRFFDAGLFWIDPLLRLLVIWSGMFGAVVASREKQHIAIDLLSRFLQENVAKWMRRLLSLAAFCICSLLCWEGYRFVVDEASFGGRVLLGIPSWLQNTVFPLAFGLMALHFLGNSITLLEEGGNPVNSMRTFPPAAGGNRP